MVPPQEIHVSRGQNCGKQHVVRMVLLHDGYGGLGELNNARNI